MNSYQQETAIKRMNHLAKDGKPFVFIVSYDCRQTFVEEVDNIDRSELLFDFPHRNNIPPDAVAGNADVEWEFAPPSRERYRHAIRHVIGNERDGNSYLANLTCRVPVRTNLALRDIFLRSKAMYRCWMRDNFVCFSPEIFVRVSNGKISSYPMKGTIDALQPNARETLLSSPKEAAEHATIVDLIRNDLSKVAEHVTVERYRYIDRLTTNKGKILQTSSEISGQLLPQYVQRPGDMLFQLLPAGSITGAPKLKTTQIIKEAEDYERGFYTGVMGIWEDGRMDSAVMIRFIDKEGEQIYYKAGGGITARSDEEAEYNEVLEKIYVPIY